jgi:hypothetical protein
VARLHARRHGRAVQVDPVKPQLKAPGTNLLTLEYDELLSTFAVKFILRRYTMVAEPHCVRTQVGRCRLPLSKPVLKECMVSAFEATIRRTAFKLRFRIQLAPLNSGVHRLRVPHRRRALLCHVHHRHEVHLHQPVRGSHPGPCVLRWGGAG